MDREPLDVKLELPEITAVTALKLFELFSVKEEVALMLLLLMAVD